jgi:2-methylisocitrate lyase-like PEP mutase family enzyme
VGKPVNVLAPMVRGADLAALAAAGAKRLSVGGALARAAMTALVRAGEEMQATGTFTWTMGLTPGEEVARLFRRG